MNDDFNSPMVIAHLFEAVKWINALKENKISINQADKEKLIFDFENILFDVLGIAQEPVQQNVQLTDDLMELILSIRRDAKNKKDFATSDLIRNKLQGLHISIKDTKEGTDWSIE